MTFAGLRVDQVNTRVEEHGLQVAVQLQPALQQVLAADGV